VAKNKIVVIVVVNVYEQVV